MPSSSLLFPHYILQSSATTSTNARPPSRLHHSSFTQTQTSPPLNLLSQLHTSQSSPTTSVMPHPSAAIIPSPSRPLALPLTILPSISSFVPPSPFSISPFCPVLSCVFSPSPPPTTMLHSCAEAD
ncbi:unnamed protein product [Pleuronectes platessa]|uniref:Uncharacterized protein n=1 Tax=Pleuronectes platessa TaxID=8262 RepID=A0A9N7YHP8_PLEPL|nr:unnamed protein product [Pleuronectes platessa]